MMNYGKSLARQMKQHGSVRTAVLLDGPRAGERVLWTGNQIFWSRPEMTDWWTGVMPQLNAAPIGRVSALDGMSIFSEQLVSAPRLVVLGGGHISLPISQIGKILGFHVTVVDDRLEFANRERFPMADEVICADFAAAIDQIPAYANAYYVIVTRGHAADGLCVECLLPREYAYLGMIGSKTKVAKTRQKLLEKGFSEIQLDTMHAPIGLNIGGETPGEIAVSIAAEIVQIKNQVKMTEIEQNLQEALDSAMEPVILATIIVKAGSSPRGIGSRMLVSKDGLAGGTIGGGAVEFAAIHHSQEMLAEGIDFAVELYDLSDSKSASLGMICGGRVQVLFERIQ